MILAGLRKLGDSIRAEVKYMPILDDIMDHDVLGPVFREGEQKGIREGEQKGELKALRRIITQRFGQIPAAIDQRLSKLSTAELDELTARLLNAKNIEELFKRVNLNTAARSDRLPTPPIDPTRHTKAILNTPRLSHIVTCKLLTP